MGGQARHLRCVRSNASIRSLSSQHFFTALAIDTGSGTFFLLTLTLVGRLSFVGFLGMRSMMVAVMVVVIVIMAMTVVLMVFMRSYLREYIAFFFDNEEAGVRDCASTSM